VVFTLPEQIAGIAYQNKRELYGILFRAAAETLRTIAADSKHLGAEIGFFAVLHTWGQNLLHHPHLHCVVPGGGLSAEGTAWIACQAGFFLSVRVLSRLFRRLFLEYLVKAFDAGKLEFFSSLQSLRDRSSFLDYLAPLRKAEWVVYPKRPFTGPDQVLDYVGRYTHRVAISNNRLLEIAEGNVTFRYRDYRPKMGQGRVRTMGTKALLIHPSQQGVCGRHDPEEQSYDPQENSSCCRGGSGISDPISKQAKRGVKRGEWSNRRIVPSRAGESRLTAKQAATLERVGGRRRTKEEGKNQKDR
jgi:hypothetical protein